MLIDREVQAERPPWWWPSSAICFEPKASLAAQDFFRDPLRTGDRAVDRRVLAI